MPRLIEITTNNHLGDTLALTGALANARLALPDVDFVYSGNYGPVFDNTPWKCGVATERVVVKYRDFGTRDYAAPLGNLVEGLTINLGRHLGVELHPYVKMPVIRLGKDEAYPMPTGCVVVNTNCQDNSTVKAWPWWAGLFEMCPQWQFVLIGGTEARDVRMDLGKDFPNVTDLRGKTNIRELFALVRGSIGVVSPSSAVSHVAAAFGIPQIVLLGARECAGITDYPNATHISSVCVGKETYWRDYGCMNFKTQDARRCEHTVSIGGRSYASCMACIPPEAVKKAMAAFL